MMIYTSTHIQGKKKEFHQLEQSLKSLGFDRWTWDYEKVVYDKKYVVGENTYYLRVQGNVINNKPLENPKSLLELQQPVFVEHFFPHGLDDTVDTPKELADDVDALLKQVEESLNK